MRQLRAVRVAHLYDPRVRVCSSALQHPPPAVAAASRDTLCVSLAERAVVVDVVVVALLAGGVAVVVLAVTLRARGSCALDLFHGVEWCRRPCRTPCGSAGRCRRRPATRW